MPAASDTIRLIPGMTDSRPSIRPLARLRPFLAPYRGGLVLAFIALTLAAAAILALPLVVRRAIDLGFSRANAEHIN